MSTYRFGECFRIDPRFSHHLMLEGLQNLSTEE